jgi:AcrR family transcriptional regulator
VAKRTAKDTAPTRSTRGAKGIDADQIVTAAVRICDSKGIDFLTVRGLAADLGIGTMTLYSYFRSKDEILDAVADNALGNFVVPAIDGKSPAQVVRMLAEAFLAMMREHPSVVYLLSSRVTTTQRSLRAAMEDVIDSLRRAGFTDEGAVRAYALIVTYTLGFANYQKPRPWGDDSRPDVEELRRQRSHFHASLPLPAFANLVELSELASTMASVDQFQYGLDCLIDGLIARGLSEQGETAAPDRNGRRRKAAPAGR